MTKRYTYLCLGLQGSTCTGVRQEIYRFLSGSTKKCTELCMDPPGNIVTSVRAHKES